MALAPKSHVVQILMRLLKYPGGSIPKERAHQLACARGVEIFYNPTCHGAYFWENPDA